MMKEFNMNNCKQKVSIGDSTIRVTRKGYISLSRRLVHNMRLHKGDQLLFFQDEQDPKQWYMKKDNGKQTGFKLRNYGSFHTLCFNSAYLTNQICQSWRLLKEKQSFVFQVTEQTVTLNDGQQYFSIIKLIA